MRILRIIIRRRTTLQIYFDNNKAIRAGKS